MPEASFRARIRQAIANPILQAALDANAERRIKARVQAFASLPDVEARRKRAQAVRAEVIAHLDEHLDRFIASAERHGMRVYRAHDAAEAVRLVLQIAASAPRAAPSEPLEKSLLFAKSKSMVSEEIGLNHALEAAGHRVVETDLGEYIVQLRGERPSHIITPAVHLRRQEVGQLFHEKLGIPYTEDVATLTNTARRVLRQVFLSADVGISGVNLGVAETGTLCIVTNEGNGRMVTTLPRLHIALMGIERLVPTLDDLALMLSLLPRSATGQKLSVYIQLINAPLEGQERHLILVDNGRSAVRRSPLSESLYCIRCGACLNACPAFREIGGHAYNSVYPGPIGSVISPGLFGERFIELAYACSLCGACAEACPVQIPLPDLLVRVRAGRLPQAAPPGAPLPAVLKLGLKMFALAAVHPQLFAFGQRLLGRLGRGRMLPMPPWTGWGLSRDLPAPAQTSFRDMYKSMAQATSSGAPEIAHSRPRPPAGPPDIRQPSALQGSEQEEARVTAFIRELQALGGMVQRVSAGDLNAALLAWLRERGINHIHAWADIPGVDMQALRAAGITVATEPDPSAQAGLTGALAGIAESGSLLIAGDGRHPLTASLLPPMHIAILPQSALVATLEEAMAIPEIRTAAAAVLITGPSRTADIEMTLTIGVHGPGEEHVFLVDQGEGR